MIEKISSILAPQTGYCHNLIRRTIDAGKERPEIKEIRFKEALDNERKKVQSIYNSKGKIIKYNDERHLYVIYA